MEHLRVFGCDTYGHISKDERSKLKKPRDTCRLYDPIQRKVLHSRDIQFDETEKEDKMTDDNRQ